MTIQATLEVDTQKSLHQSEYRNFIESDFRKQISLIDCQAWHLRESHTKSADDLVDEDQDSGIHNNECHQPAEIDGANAYPTLKQ